MYFQDGYKLISAEQLLGGLHALNERQITFRAFRTFIASFEVLAVREAAERSKGAKSRKPQRRFLRSELAHLIGAREGMTISRELSSLRTTGLLTFSETVIASDAPYGCSSLLSLLGGRGGKRLVPVPRQVLKYLAKCNRPAVAKTVVAYLIRGLALERTGRIRSAGTVKISWICRLCQISERAARAARAELIRLGWITKDTGSFQRKLNRDGAYFVINPAWRRVAKRSAPLAPEKCSGSAPPIEIPETPYGSKNQKAAQPQRAASRPVTGVCTANEGNIHETPSLRDIKPEDLKRLSRLKVLYAEATAAKWLNRSEANLRNFVAAAARATRVDGDPVRVFVGIVRKALWHHLTSADEERATSALRRERDRQVGTKAGKVSALENGGGERSVRFVLDLATRRATTGDPNTNGKGPTAVCDLERLVSGRQYSIFFQSHGQIPSPAVDTRSVSSQRRVCATHTAQRGVAVQQDLTVRSGVGKGDMIPLGPIPIL